MGLPGRLPQTDGELLQGCEQQQGDDRCRSPLRRGGGHPGQTSAQPGCT